MLSNRHNPNAGHFKWPLASVLRKLTVELEKMDLPDDQRNEIAEALEDNIRDAQREQMSHNMDEVAIGLLPAEVVNYALEEICKRLRNIA